MKLGRSINLNVEYWKNKKQSDFVKRYLKRGFKKEVLVEKFKELKSL